MARRAEIPPAIARSLETLFGCSVATVEIYEHSLFARAHIRAIATTRRDRIYLRGSAADFFESPTLMLHEFCHVLFQWRTGTMTTWRYVIECIRRGYWNNRFEIEARSFAERHVARFRRLAGESAEQGFAMIETPGDRAE